MSDNTPDREAVDDNRLQLAVIDGHIEHAKRGGYSTQITLHALNILRGRFAGALDEIERLRSEEKTRSVVMEDLIADNHTRQLMINARQAQLDAKDTEIAAIKLERDEYREVADKFAADVQEAHQRWLALQVQLDTVKEALTATIEEDRKTIGKLESDLAAVTDEAKRYRSQIAERNATIDRMMGVMKEVAVYAVMDTEHRIRLANFLQSLKEPNT